MIIEIEGYETDLKILVEQQQDISRFVQTTKSRLDEIGTLLVAEALETLDEAVRGSKERKTHWHIHSREDPNSHECHQRAWNSFPAEHTRRRKKHGASWIKHAVQKATLVIFILTSYLPGQEFGKKLASIKWQDLGS